LLTKEAKQTSCEQRYVIWNSS